MKKTRIGIIGCGSIGSSLAIFVEKKLYKHATVLALCDESDSRAQQLRSKLRKSKPFITTIDGVIKRSDFIIESASAGISFEIAKKSLQRSKGILVMSIGGIIVRFNELFALARRKKAPLYLPSGAICGIDGLKALSIANIKKVVLVTRKPPQAFKGAPYIVEKNINLDAITTEAQLFSGSALEAIKYFPQNINVAALLSIAGIGANKTEVCLIAVPGSTKNSHQIQIDSDAGTIVTRCDNVPFPENPKTSYLAALSAMAVLKNIFDPVKLGN